MFSDENFVFVNEGLVIYFFYGADNSSENEVEEEEIYEETNITTDEVVE